MENEMKHTFIAVLLASALAAPAAFAQTGGAAAGAGGNGAGVNAGATAGNNGGMPSQRVANENAQGSGAILTISPSGVREVQQALNRLGYSAGPVDGVWNQATARAMVHFQQAHGLEPNGNLTISSIAALGLWKNIIGDPNGNGNKALTAQNSGAPPARGGKESATVGGAPLPSQRITNEAPGGGAAGTNGSGGGNAAHANR
jgi:peptidoglycan hydrolase-like protein with peptidoglycan-binding domain